MNDYLAAVMVSGGVGDSLREHSPTISESLAVRDALQKAYGRALPSDEAIALLVSAAPIVEVGAGLGYWASLILAAGGDILATDDYSWHKDSGGPYDFARRHGTVLRMDAAVAAAMYPDRILLMIWPPYNDPMAVNALRAYAGRRVAYVGEGDGGCTGDENFHRLLADEWRAVEHIALPQWWGAHDALYIYERRAA